MPLPHRGQVGVVVGHGVHDETVDTGLLHHRGGVDVVAPGPGRNEQQALAGGFAGFGEAREETHRGGITEGVTERLGQQQAHGTGAAGAQRAGDGSGPG